MQTVRECQSIQGCPFSFKQLREKLRKKEAQKISSNVPLPPGPVWPISSKRKNEPSHLSFQPKPYTRPQNRPRPLPPVHKPESLELFSNEEPTLPFKDTKTGDDEMEEIFGPPPISKKPLGFHQGVDENFNYEYDKPWRPGQNEDNSYNHNSWKNHGRPRPQPKPFSRPGNEGPHRMPPRPRPGGNQSGNQNRYPPQNQNSQNSRRPPPPVVVKSRPKKPVSRPPVVAPVTTTTTPRSPFPKKKISYLNSPYNKPNMNSGEDDEGSEDINKVAPVELIGNLDAGEQEQTTKATTTAKPKVTETTTASSSKKKKDDDDDSDEYDDDDYYDDDYDEDDQDDEYSDEEEDDKEVEAKKKKQKEKVKDRKKKKEEQKKKEKEEEEEDEEEEDEEEEKTTTSTSTTTKAPVTKKKKKVNFNQYIDDENEGLEEMWTKLNFATTGANHKAPEKYKKTEKTSGGESEGVQEAIATVSDEDAEADDAEEEEDEEDAKKGSLMTLQKVRASSSSASDEDDDELDEENLSKTKRYKLKSKGKKTKTKKDEDEEELAADLAEIEGPITREEIQTKPGKPKSKTKKSKKKPAKKGSSEEEDVSAATRRKQVMMEIGGRPLVPKPDLNQSNQKKTNSLIGNRFKFQFINPYGPAPPSDSNLPGAYSQLKTSFGPNPVGSSAGTSMGGSHPSAMSSLPFKFKLNPGALGNLAGGGGGHMVPIGGFPGGGSSSSASGSIELPDPHHPPQSSSMYSPPPQQNLQAHQQRHEHFSAPSAGLSGGSMGGSSLFKLNPLPALSNFFKRPSSSSFDPMSGPDGHGPPPATAFVHRPIGPESSHYNRERPSPASGSSNPMSVSSSSGGSSTKKYKAKSKSKSNKGKSGKLNKNSMSNTFIF